MSMSTTHHQRLKIMNMQKQPNRLKAAGEHYATSLLFNFIMDMLLKNRVGSSVTVTRIREDSLPLYGSQG